MKTVLLDGAVITGMMDVHTAFADALEFPEWYGRNLDALYDLLTEPTEEITVLIAHRTQLIDTLGGRCFALLRLLHDAMEQNPRLRVAESWVCAADASEE